MTAVALVSTAAQSFLASLRLIRLPVTVPLNSLGSMDRRSPSLSPALLLSRSSAKSLARAVSLSFDHLVMSTLTAMPLVLEPPNSPVIWLVVQLYMYILVLFFTVHEKGTM